METIMADDRDSNAPTHRAYSVIKRDGQDDYWLNLGLVFPHKDGGGFNIMLQALPLDRKIVCREITVDDRGDGEPQSRSRQRGGSGGRRR
jgi:hypothetical protein